MGAAVIEWITNTRYSTVALWIGSFVAVMFALDVLTYLGAKLARRDGLPYGEARLRLIRLQIRWGEVTDDNQEQQAESDQVPPNSPLP